MPKLLSAKRVIKILCREFGFCFISQRGSHVKLRRKIKGRKITTIIPLHKELSPGTLRGILELGEVEEDEFFKLL